MSKYLLMARNAQDSMIICLKKTSEAVTVSQKWFFAQKARKFRLKRDLYVKKHMQVTN